MPTDRPRAHSAFYDWYLSSPLWHLRRYLWWRFSDRRCEICRCPLQLHRVDGPDEVVTVHHLTYVRLGRERRSDVQLLCWPCHLAAESFVAVGRSRSGKTASSGYPAMPEGRG